MTMLVLHDYWRSGAAYRVRIALNLKGIDFALVPHDLRTGEQRQEDYLAIAPQGLVPAIEYGALRITQSMAIIEWLDEKWPEPRLLPTGADERAIVRSMAQTIACDVHPLNNLRVLKYLSGPLATDQAGIDSWIGHWIAQGFSALEAMVARFGAGFAFADAPTLADCCLIPQLYSARRFNVDLSAFPRLRAIEERAAEHEAFARAHPAVQPGAD